MLRYRESLVSAHHNYLVNQMLSPGFLLGNPDSQDEFYFLADIVPLGESEPRIYARFYDSRGGLVLEIEPKKILENPGQCVRQAIPGGYRITHPSGEPLMTVHTQNFANGYLTRIQAKLYDREGRLRMEPSYDSIQVYSEAHLTLSSPYK